MARGKYITEFERDVIRLGVAAGKSASEIGRMIFRTRAAVGVQIKAMTEDGTIGKLPECIAERVRVGNQ